MGFRHGRRKKVYKLSKLVPSQKLMLLFKSVVKLQQWAEDRGFLVGR